jgi:RNA polymerase sigma factor (sigma-70 family)
MRIMNVQTRHSGKLDATAAFAAYSANHVVNGTMPESIRVTEIDATSGPAWALEIAAIRDKQDQAAFRRLFLHFAPRIKGFLIKSGSPADIAEDCAQEVMATVWRKAAQFDPSRASASTWIFTIARNKRIDVVRRERRPEPEDLPWGPEAETDQEDALVLEQETERLSKAISALPEKQRRLIQRAFYGDLSHRELAEETGLPLGTIKSRIRLALDRLRHEMK